MAEWMQAGAWGLLAGSALLAGAALGYGVRIPPRTVASIMAFGAGVLISAVSFELIADAHEQGGLGPTVVGALAGAAIYTSGSLALSTGGRRTRPTGASADPPDEESSGSALALGAVLDGVPESIAIGASLLGGATVSLVTVIAVFISNIPEGLSSAAGMRRAGRPASHVFRLWTGITLLSGLAAVAGYVVVGGASPALLAGIMALAAGGILAMLADTMIPEAYRDGHLLIGFVLVIGFLIAFGLSSVEM